MHKPKKSAAKFLRSLQQVIVREGKARGKGAENAVPSGLVDKGSVAKLTAFPTSSMTAFQEYSSCTFPVLDSSILGGQQSREEMKSLLRAGIYVYTRKEIQRRQL